MFFLRLTCSPDRAEWLSAELWDAGTAGIQEIDQGGEITLLSGFETNGSRESLLQRFARYRPEWEHDDATDWIAHTKDAWPPRRVGNRLFLTPPWHDGETPPGCIRIVHNPGLACGTGEHPCTQLALEALEKYMLAGRTVADIGTGSGILAIAALRLGATTSVGLDTDEAALAAARENFALNGLPALLAAGSAEAVRAKTADVTVANISGTVLLAIAEDLLRITKPKGTLILTGFPEWELSALQGIFCSSSVSAMNEWRCIVANL
ncbi:MAG TPA: 50S ribosomal protein L11 methyltransferase [Bryobacteraceae bacterium]|nr:50S ribosomal protein L11 methyltransferase [Bryobacteraceae bacterium]